LRTKKLRASKASLRRYSKTVPRSWLVPARQHLELARLLDRRRDDHGVERELVVVDAVDEPGVGVGLVAQGVEVGGPAWVERAGAGQILACLPRRDAWHEVDERCEVAPVERQFLDGRLLDDGADLGGVGADDRRAGHHGRLLFDSADLE
jgi:hypothetical protein